MVKQEPMLYLPHVHILSCSLANSPCLSTRLSRSSTAMAQTCDQSLSALTQLLIHRICCEQQRVLSIKLADNATV